MIGQLRAFLRDLQPLLATRTQHELGMASANEGLGGTEMNAMTKTPLIEPIADRQVALIPSQHCKKR